MTTQFHLELLREGTQTRNTWINTHPSVVADFSEANLEHLNLDNAHLISANFVGAYLSWTDFHLLVPRPTLAACNGHVFLVALPGMLDWTKEGLSWPLSFSKDIMELLMETKPASFTKFFQDYVEMWSLFAHLFLLGPAPLHRPVGMTIPRAIPLHLQAEYRLLQLHAEASLTDVRIQYRELAKLYHPDAGGHHTDFLALQQAYKQVVKYLQTRR